MSRQGRRGRSNKVGVVTPRGVVGFSTPRGGMAVAEPFTPVLEQGTPDAGAAPGSAGPDETPRRFADSDDGSYPPVDLDNHFFGGGGPLRVSEPPPEADERDPRISLKQTPEVTRRRANLQKYVKLAVAAASALCVAALLKVAVTRGAGDDEKRSPEVAAAALRPALNPAPPAIEPMVAPSATEPSAADPPAPLPTDTVPPAAQAPVDSAATAPASAPAESDPAAAAREKKSSRNSLEFGKVADSIEAGERSVALDSTDGEAWLILGAAYQQGGDLKNARRCYKSCLEQGRRGPKNECAAMLQ